MHKSKLIRNVGICTALWLANISLVLAAAKGTIVLQGRVGSECSITDSVPTSVQLGTLDTIGTATINFGFSCNSAFTYTLESQYGGLKQTAAATDTIVYSLAVTLPTDSGSGISETWSSDDIKVGNTPNFANSGTGIATDQDGKVVVSWTANSELPVGNYTDSLTIEIKPSI